MPATDPGPFSPAAGGLRVTLRLQPGARRAGIDGVIALADGTRALGARVHEPPEGGRANAALIKLLAKTWKLPKGTISIVSGESRRLKILMIAGDPAQLGPRLARWLAER